MLLVRLLINSRLLVVKYWGSKNYMLLFNCISMSKPHTVQGSAVFKFICIFTYVFIFPSVYIKNKDPLFKSWAFVRVLSKQLESY